MGPQIQYWPICVYLNKRCKCKGKHLIQSKIWEKMTLNVPINVSYFSLLDLIFRALPPPLSAGKKEEYFCVTVS